MTKLPLSATACLKSPAFAKNYETNEAFCQAVEQRMFAALVLPETCGQLLDWLRTDVSDLAGTIGLRT